MMELKKFEAPTLAQALQVIKKELGPDAIIVSTRNNKSGFGILGGSSVEVTAAVSREALDRKASAESRMSERQIEALQNKPSRKVSQAYDVLSGATIEKKLAQARSTYSDRGQDSIAQKLASQTLGHRTNLMTASAIAATRELESRMFANRAQQADQFTIPRDSQNESGRGRGIGALFPTETGGAAESNRILREIQSGSGTYGDPARAERSESPITQRRYIDITDDDSPAEQATSHSRDQARIGSSAREYSQQSQNYPTHAAPQYASATARESSNQNAREYLAPSQRIVTPSTVPHVAQQLLPKVLAELIESGIEPDLVRELGDELKVIMIREQIVREDILRMQLARILMARIRVAKPLSERLRLPSTPRLISFVGPTGVGKTTTIAKIAAELVINQNRRVVLATTDTYKIAAIEQLQTYANILRIPLEVCPSVEALEQLATSVAGDQVVLIDTAGYGPKDEKKIHELRDLLTNVKTEIHLCLTAMTRDRDLSALVKRFKLFDPQYLVMTKLDETSSFGGIFNVSVRNQLPLSYFTMGQRVPEDMEIATKERIADLILNISGGTF